MSNVRIPQQDDQEVPLTRGFMGKMPLQGLEPMTFKLVSSYLSITFSSSSPSCLTVMGLIIFEIDNNAILV